MCVKRTSSGNDITFARIGIDGNIYASGSVIAGGLQGGEEDAGAYDDDYGGGTTSSSPWVVDQDIGGNFTVVKDASWRVGVGTLFPEAKLHVVGGGVVADSLRGSLPFSDLTGVPHASSNTAGIVRLSLSIMDDDTTVAASARTLKETNDALSASRVKKSGDTMTGSLSLLNGGNLIVSSAGKVGVGLASPNYSVDVRGDINFTGKLFRDGTEYHFQAPWRYDTQSAKVYLSAPGFPVGIGTSAPQQALHVVGTVKADNFSGDGSGLTNIALANVGQGVLPVDRGGTGAQTLGESKLLVGMGSDPVQSPSALHWDTQNERLGIGEPDPQDALHVIGSIRVSGSLYETSDERVKTNIRSYDGALDAVSRLTGYKFNRTDIDNTDATHVGLIAQEVLTEVPEAVRKDYSSGMYSVSYGNMVPVLVEALKDLRAEKDREISGLQAELAMMWTKLDDKVSKK
jgi:hypothetical protein